MLFNRQVLYLVFLFASSSVHGAPAQTTVPASSRSSASRDDAPTLRLDISPQVISSTEAFASQTVTAVLSPESNSGARSRSSATRLPDDVESTSESYPPVALQSATRIVTPSDPKNPAAVSSTSTRRRSRTTFSTSPVSTGNRRTLTSSTLTSGQGRPHRTSRTTDARVSSHHHTTQAGPANTQAAGAQAAGNLTALNSTQSMDGDSQGANMTGATVTNDELGRLLTAIGQVGELSGSDPASATGFGSATGDNEPPEATNALDVLISALPSSLAAPIQSEYSDIIDPIGSGINSLTHNIFGAGETSSRTRTRPTTSPSTIRTSTTDTSSPSPTTTGPPTGLPPPTTITSDPTSTLQTRPSTTDTAAAAATTTEGAGPTAANPSENAATIGIATGVASGVVLIGLAGLYLWRRRQQGKAPFARTGSNRSKGVYPEVAWLYDPDITPPRSRAGSGSGTHLIPEPRPGSVEIGGTPVMGGMSGGASPEMRPAQPSSPLLAPVLRGSRDMTGSRSRSGSEVDYDRLRPLSTLREESGRQSMS